MSINSHIQSIMFYDLLIALLFNLVFHHILTVIETYCSSLTSVVCACNICNLCIQYALAQQMVCYPFLCCTEFLFQILMNLYKIRLEFHWNTLSFSSLLQQMACRFTQGIVYIWQNIRGQCRFHKYSFPTHTHVMVVKRYIAVSCRERRPITKRIRNL